MPSLTSLEIVEQLKPLAVTEIDEFGDAVMTDQALEGLVPLRTPQSMSDQ
jgi:hypothetical protein